MINYKKLLNYIGLLRLYSFLDIIIFSCALTHNPKTILALGLLWYGGIFFNEWLQQDALREKISSNVHLALLFPTFFLLPLWLSISWIFCTFLYASKKKHAFFGISAPFWRGIHSSLLALAFKPSLVPLAFTLTFVRNIIGDFRDAGYDYNKRIQTIPIMFGIIKNQHWAYFVHLGAIIGTTLVWGYYASFPFELLILTVLVEIMIYPLTPRASSPYWINIYETNSTNKEASKNPVLLYKTNFTEIIKQANSTVKSQERTPN